MDQHAPTPSRNGSRERSWPSVLARLGIGILTLALVGAGIYVWKVRTGGASGAPGHTAAAPGPMPVSVVEVRAQPVALTPRFLGRTEASQTVQIRARINGFLEAREFEEGTVVEARQVLFRIDPRPFEAELAVARARLENARARAARARRQVERLQGAAEQGAASLTELDQQLTEEQVALSDVRLEEARVYQAELDLGYTTIESPIRGVVGRALRDVGSYLQAGQEALLAVVQQIDPIYVTYSISEQELLRWNRLLEEGLVTVPDPQRIPLAIELADGTPYPHVGHLNFVGTQIEATTATTILRGDVPNPDHRLRPGQFVRVQPLGVTRSAAILVPQSAVLQSPGGASVYIVGADGLAHPRSVVVGDWVGDAVIIEDGLTPGDRVIANHLSRLRPGTPVEVAEVLAAPAAPPAAPPPAAAPPAASNSPAAANPAASPATVPPTPAAPGSGTPPQ